ncbi:unnamed protein product [Moneuplotes crassus]|uniref:Phosphodiesterase n=1 Tax=Euplotes crassus TaxID=5936 RepID=A0AAD2D5J8_EUPCR|nr:unnamed protein product [Moneuplotes crassus]
MNIFNPRRYSEAPKINASDKLKMINSPRNAAENDLNDFSESSMEEFPGREKLKLPGVRSVKNKTLTLNLPSSKRTSIAPRRNIMSMQSSEFEEENITGVRKSLAKELQIPWINICRALVIIIYFGITIIMTSLNEDLDKGSNGVLFHAIESVFISLFILEIVLFRYAFKRKYYENKFNIVNSMFVALIFVFWLLDIVITNYTVSVLLRMRGSLRLVYIPIIIEHIHHHIKIIREEEYRQEIENGDHPTTDQIVQILMRNIEIISDDRVNSDLKYCMKHIAKGDLDQGSQVDVQVQELKSLKRRRNKVNPREEHAWIRSFSNVFTLRRETNESGTIIMSVTNNHNLDSLLDVKFNITEVMESLETLDFDIFDFKEKTENRELTTVASLLLNKHSLYTELGIQPNEFLILLDKVASGYDAKVPYHNATHAADVCQTLYCFMVKGNWITLSQLGNLDLLSMILGASVHDYEHPGVNNMYLINSSDKLAIRYNDESVLENHHIASASDLLKTPQYDILRKMDKEDKKQVRKRMVHMVLATDMSKHFKDLGTFKSKMNTNSLDPIDKDLHLCLGMGMHLADISNPTKPWHLTHKWIELLFDEFFKQGDKEKKFNYPISDLMDRKSVNIAKAQLGFIDVIVLPSFECFSGFLKSIEENIKNMKKNRANWAERIDEYEERMNGEKRLHSRGEVIEEVKELSDEESESNKMLTFRDSTENQHTVSKQIEGSKSASGLDKESSFEIA